MFEACCTCANLLTSIPPIYDEKTEKLAQHERRLGCCGRVICARCVTDNPRFASYCPFCQISSAPSPLPQGLRKPPAYSTLNGEHAEDQPPPYASHDLPHPSPEKVHSPSTETAPDVLHFVDAVRDTIPSLSLQYGVPSEALRRTNNIFANHLLAARRAILIPGEYYKGGISLSPRPLEGEEEEIRKGKVRKFMVGCKVAEYDVALLYLQHANYDLSEAMGAYKSDEKWEKEYPLEAAKKGKSKVSRSGRRKGWLSSGLTSQM